MYDKDFAELVKIAAEKLKEDTVYKMLIHSEDYQKESDERDKAERNYEQLDLTMEQRKVCDVFLDYRDRQSLEYSDYSYLAGRSVSISSPKSMREWTHRHSKASLVLCEMFWEKFKARCIRALRRINLQKAKSRNAKARCCL